jgi:nicotinamidase/pyrazinamidase
MTKTIAWNVDTQYDFMRPDGKLYVRDAETIEPALAKLTGILRLAEIPIVHTGDWHTKDTVEISDKPDFKKTYPAHCMADTGGAMHVMASAPRFNMVLDWREAEGEAGKHYLSRHGPAALPDGRSRFDFELDYAITEGNVREFLLYKDKFDVFEGTRFTEPLLERLNPERAIVYGVATNVCVNDAVRGLRARGIDVVVVDDAIKELPAEHAQVPLETILAEWKALGVRHTTVTDIWGAYIDDRSSSELRTSADVQKPETWLYARREERT